MTVSPFGTLPDGRLVERITLTGGGLTAQILTHGARVQDLRLNGVAHPLVLGADTLAPYLGAMRYVGAMVGRFANRIGGAQFAIDGQTFRTDPNFRDRHTLHGGADGIDQHLWTLAELAPDRVLLTLDLPDGHMGFPGALAISVAISLDSPGALGLDITATTDAPTPVSLAHHGYFTLRDGAPVTDLRLRVDADHYTAVDSDLIPVGPPCPVRGSAFDFRATRSVGTHGYDHNFCLSDARTPLRPVARLDDPETGLFLDVATTEPGLQVYDGAHLGDLPGLEGRRYGAHSGMALETQGWPDAPNRPDFPDAILRPGATYRHLVVYRFGKTKIGRA